MPWADERCIHYAEPAPGIFHVMHQNVHDDSIRLSVLALEKVGGIDQLKLLLSQKVPAAR